MTKFSFKNIFKIALGAGILFSVASCEKYLDKEADTTIEESEAFKNFTNFQGYVEQIYSKIPNKFACNWSPSWNWGEDELFNINDQGRDRMTSYIDIGDFRRWYISQPCWLYRNGGDAQKGNGIWNKMWGAIRVANMGIEKIDLIKKGEYAFEGTEEELDLLKGQMLFFRGWWHYEMVCYIGHLPYIDRSFPKEEEVSLSVPSSDYNTVLEKCMADFKAAADLLPWDWDDTKTGSSTAGANDLRINKVMALGYYGKAALWAASPLAVQGAKVHGDSYLYDKEKAKIAAEAFGQILAKVDEGCQYKLAKFAYTEPYDHKNGSQLGEWSQIFYNHKGNGEMPGVNEAIMRPLVNGADADFCLWQHAHVWGPKFGGMVDGDNLIHQATANYVDYAYGMKNGLPICDPASGFDSNHPWKDRDPRFYHDIVFDGFKFINGTPEANQPAVASHKYCNLYSGGNMRDDVNGSRTGYLIQKLVPHTSNIVDKSCEYMQYYCQLSYMRLADIYLMYAEAASAAASSPNGGSSTCKLRATEALNIIRERVGVDPVSGEYASDFKIFMQEVRRERACELAWEGFRFADLQRWLLLTESEELYNGKLHYNYTIKQSAEFDRDYDVEEKYNKIDGYDPKDGEVTNWGKKTIVERNFDEHNYWFPVPVGQTYFTKDDFQQNPGW